MKMPARFNTLKRCLQSLCILVPLTALAGPSTAVETNSTNGFGVSLADDRLQANRGGSEMMKTEMSLSGSTAQNNAEQVVTGSNAISAGSFANASGIPIVIQNSGANVLIQNATILNLQMR